MLSLSLVNRNERSAFLVLLAMVLKDDILTNDFQAHNATTVSGTGRLREFMIELPCDDEER